jgi:hypothetical protein
MAMNERRPGRGPGSPRTGQTASEHCKSSSFVVRWANLTIITWVFAAC